MAGPDEARQPAPGQPGEGANDEQRQQRAQLPEARPPDVEAGVTAGEEAATSDKLAQQQRQEQEQSPEQWPQDPAGPKPTGGDAPAPGDRQGQQQDGEPAAHAGQPEVPQQQRQEQAEQPQQVEEEQQQDAGKEAEALARAEALKREGNELFGRGLWDEAAAKYNGALDAAPRSAARQQAIYFANLAACNIKTQQYAVAVQNCTEAIRLDGSYQKAFMRRCEAFERVDELDHALSDAKKLLEMAPDDAWARARVGALQPRVDERTEMLKAEMFSKLKDLGNSLLGNFGLSVDNFKFDKDPSTGGYSVKFER